ncbi:MAG: glycosyltransferase, partial [Thermodesulfobacteriota bacterium]
MKKKLPFFSIIIATYNRPEELSICLKAMEGINYPRTRYEVIVIDDGGKFTLDSTVEPFRNSLKLTLLRQENTGCGGARNTGVAKARGDVLAFTDDDCAPDPEWLNEMASEMRANPNRVIGGRVINALTENPYSTTSQLLTSYLYDYFRSNKSNYRFFTTSNLAISAELFNSIGGFDATLRTAEDRDLCARAILFGSELHYAQGAIIYHSHHLTFSSFCNQHYTYGRGAVYYHRKLAAYYKSKIKPDSPSFFINLLKFPFSQVGFLKAFTLSGLLLLSQIVYAAGYFMEKINPQEDKEQNFITNLSKVVRTLITRQISLKFDGIPHT